MEVLNGYQCFFYGYEMKITHPASVGIYDHKYRQFLFTVPRAGKTKDRDFEITCSPSQW